MDSKTIPQVLLDIDAVRFNAKEPFTYTSGMRSPIYCDLRLIMSYPAAREVVIRELIRKVGDTIGLSKVDVISGTATAGVPFASWIADRLHLPMIYVRKSTKGHGMDKLIEGNFSKTDRVLVVEDIISSGKSSMGNIVSVREFGATVVGSVAVASYEMKQAKQAFKKARVQLEYLAPMADVIQAATETGMLNKSEEAVVMDWLADPAGWYNRQGFEK